MQNRLVLKPMPQPAKGHCVGTYDGQPLVVEGTQATLGSRTFSVGELGEDLVLAVDAAATRLFGGDWTNSLTLVSGLNRRTCCKDRIGRNGLPGDVLHALAQGAETPFPATIGRLMLAAAKIMQATSPADAAEHTGSLMAAVASSVCAVRGMAVHRAEHRRVIAEQMPEAA